MHKKLHHWQTPIEYLELECFEMGKFNIFHYSDHCQQDHLGQNERLREGYPCCVNGFIGGEPLPSGVMASEKFRFMTQFKERMNVHEYYENCRFINANWR